MKKLLLIAVTSLLCFACDKDPQELLIKTTEVSLYPEDIIQIDAISDFDIAYLSTNTYLADVSAIGLLTANKVGKTLVEVSSNNFVIEVPVEIMGRYNVYPDPILDWGISQSDLIEIAGEPDKAYTNSIEYANYSDQAPAIAYLFTPGDSLMCAMVIVLETSSDDLTAYMDERFVFDSEEDGLSVYRNAHEEKDVTLLIGIFNGGGGSPMVLYMGYEYSETKSSQSVSMALKNMRKQL
ncbi:MAG: hypothetical protein ACERIH_07450 [Labilibaculum antarcticum]